MRRLLSSQLVEGHADEAEALLLLMARRGIEQDEHTAAVLARTQERLSKRRMWLLVRMLKEGETSRRASGHLTVTRTRTRTRPLTRTCIRTPTPTSYPSPSTNQGVGVVRQVARARVHRRVPSDRHDAGTPEQ